MAHTHLMLVMLLERKCILNLLDESEMPACKLVDTQLGEDTNGIPVDKERYQRLVGKLIYLTHSRHTFPSKANAVSVVSLLMHAPCETHKLILHRIFRYLKSALRKS